MARRNWSKPGAMVNEFVKELSFGNYLENFEPNNTDCIYLEIIIYNKIQLVLVCI